MSTNPTLPFRVVNAFSVGPFTGNPAGVVFDARSLSTEAMQRIARQFNLVETVFVISVEAATSTVALRYFTPVKELPIAGHPTIAAFQALYRAGLLVKDRAVLSIPAGRLEVVFANDRIFMEQLPGMELDAEPSRDEVASVFRLNESDILESPPLRCFDFGLGHLIVPLKSLDALMRVKRDTPRLLELCRRHGVREAQLFCFETVAGSTASLHTRNLTPHYGPEDPACGNGNAALAAYLFNYTPERSGQTLHCEQGHIVNMPAVISCFEGLNSQGARRVYVGGSAWEAMQGHLHAPDANTI